LVPFVKDTAEMTEVVLINDNFQQMGEVNEAYSPHINERSNVSSNQAGDETKQDGYDQYGYSNGKSAFTEVNRDGSSLKKPAEESWIGPAASSADENQGKRGRKQGLLARFMKHKDDKTKQKMIGLFDLFRFSDNCDKIFMILGLACSLVLGACLPLLLLTFGSLSNSFVDTGRHNTTFGLIIPTSEEASSLGAEFLTTTKQSCFYFVAIGIVVIFVAYGQVMFWLTTSHRQTNRIRQELMKAVLRQEIGWFDTHGAGELGTRITDDINKIEEGIGDKIGAFLQWMSTFVCGFIIAFIHGWKLALVILSVVPVISLLGAVMMKVLTASSEKESAAYAKAGAVAEEVLSSMRTVTAFSGQMKECNRYSLNLDKARLLGIRKAMISGGGMGLLYLVIFCTWALSFWFGGQLTIWEPQNYTVGTVLIVFLNVLVGAMALGNATPNLQKVATARGAAFIIWEIIDRVPEIDRSSPSGLCPSTLTGYIEVKDVSFSYPSRPESKILKGLTLEIRKGQTVALVGSSGCGKSTVIQLLQRFYNPASGSICVDGTDIRELNVKWLRSKIGVVSQEPVLFSTTIAENIKFGREGVTQAEIEQATKESNAYDFICKLPQKFETMVGERGAQLSGGQKQRIAIARALVRDPKILLLDEATSALDTENEAAVQGALDKARQGRTTIVVAHRLCTIQTADVIYGIKDGVVHESGTHEELMKIGGIYHTLVTNQCITEEDEEEDVSDSDSGEEVCEKFKIKRITSQTASRRSLKRMKSINPSEIASPSKEKEEYPEVSMMRVFKLNSTEWLEMTIGCIMALIHGGIQPIFGIIFANILGMFALTPEEQQSGIFFNAMMFIVLGSGTAISMFLQGWTLGISGEALTKRIRQRVFEALLRQQIAFFDDPRNHTGTLTTILATDASAVQGATGYRLGMMLQAAGSLLCALIIGFIFSWKCTLFIIGIMPIFFVGALIQMKMSKGVASKNNEGFEAAGKISTEVITNVRTVASLSKEEYFLEEFAALIGRPHRNNLISAQGFGVAFCFLQSMSFFAFAAILYFGAWLIVYDGLSYVNMFKVYTAIRFAAIAAGKESQFGPDYGKGKIAASRIFALLDKDPGPANSYSTEGKQPTRCQGVVEFKDVHFAYPTRPTVPVLRGMNVKVGRGETYALVGSSGCGKSTSVQLLQRFYDTLQGEVMVDGEDIKGLNVGWLRGQIGLVSQEPVLFDYSLRENIAYGDNSREVTMDEIIEAAKKANIHNFISTLPQGYETSAGDKGTQLSGGQKQRIAIARALIRNPTILLLDEATSALDTESEKIVQEALDRAQQGRTSIVIAHRLSTIQNATCIVVFSNGRIAERGTHFELMAHKGLYYKLNLAQGNKK